MLYRHRRKVRNATRKNKNKKRKYWAHTFGDFLETLVVGSHDCGVAKRGSQAMRCDRVTAGLVWKVKKSCEPQTIPQDFAAASVRRRRSL